jgi:DNA-binding NarL/FixJ family response regulator
VLIYSAFADHPLVLAAIIAGADGLLSKQTLDEELCFAIRALARGRKYFPAVPAALMRALRERLEPRDRALFDMLIHGLAVPDMTARLRVTRAELETRRRVMLSTLAPNAARGGVTSPANAPLDYERSRRQKRYRAA